MADSTPEKLRRFRVSRRKPTGKNKSHHSAPRSGIRNNKACDLTGYTRGWISAMASQGRFTRHDDGSYNTTEFERWVRSRGAPDFVVPAGMRGTLYEEGNAESEAEAVHAVIVHPDPPSSNGVHSNGSVDYYSLEQELIELRVQSERLKVEQQTLRLQADKGEYVPRSLIAKTVADAIVLFRESLLRVGGELAASLTGMDDEYEIKRRIDAAMAAVLKRLQERIHEAMRG